MAKRIQKSRQAINDAFMRLMSEKEFESITINQIAAEANVNRGTVYLHFDDKYDLREQCMTDEINQLLRHCMSGDDLVHLPSKTALLHTFEYLEQHASFYSIMLKSKGSMVFRNQMETMFRKSLIEHLDSINLDQDWNRDITVQFLISASVGVLEWWIIRSMPYPPSVMVEQFWNLLNPVVEGHEHRSIGSR
ncbi:TetR/AcrR family transcriptional regulator [Paenibacillus sp. JNUCC31]|uniref:TetR/AcrR family transcriptional regulator n=1 Tax=Paenibacillus sp. JNUCC-31 TaxID=2777983 RepID=UPI0017821F9C|nr:TetR/AcrR family transcriptional regulator [Paenibacillus sp. JNUCC-31]QOS79496.1 TetR/AcrR family transcriptional regulator [Paenibacillus sp. JNUCC-31]